MQKAKQYSRETLYVLGAFLCMLVMIVVTSIGQAGLSFESIFAEENTGNILVNASITIFGMVVSIPLGISATKQRVNPDGSLGRYLTEFSAYNKIRKTLDGILWKFSQWHTAQHLKELYDKQLNYLHQFNVLQAEAVLKLSREQIIELHTPQCYHIDGEDVYFKTLTPEQIKHCLEVYDGKVTVNKLPDFYFLYVDGKTTRSYYDQAYYETKDENWYTISSVALKVFVGFVITCIFTGLTFTANDPDVGTRAWILKMLLIMFTRIFNAVSSIWFGYMTGKELVYKQCFYINGKTQFLTEFISDTNFVYKDVQELAKDEFVERSLDGRSDDSISKNGTA